MFNAGFDLLGTAPALQPLADLAMHVLEHDSSVRVLMGQVVLHAKRSNALLHISLALRWAATGRVSIAIPRRQRRQNFEGYSSSHRLDRGWECAARYDSQQIDA